MGAFIAGHSNSDYLVFWSLNCRDSGARSPIFTPSELKNIPVRQRDPDALYIAPCRPVLKAPRTRSIRRHCPAHLTAPLGRVRRIEKPLGLDSLRKIAKYDPRLNHRTHRVPIDALD